MGRKIRVDPLTKLTEQILNGLIARNLLGADDLEPLVEYLQSGHLGLQRQALDYVGVLRPGTAHWTMRPDTLVDGVGVYLRRMPRLTRENPALAAVVSVVAELSLGHHVEWAEISGTLFHLISGLSLYRVKQVCKLAESLRVIEKRAGKRTRNNHVTPNLYRLVDPSKWPKSFKSKSSIGVGLAVVEKSKNRGPKRAELRPRRKRTKSTTAE